MVSPVVWPRNGGEVDELGFPVLTRSSFDCLDFDEPTTDWSAESISSEGTWVNDINDWDLKSFVSRNEFISIDLEWNDETSCGFLDWLVNDSPKKDGCDYEVPGLQRVSSFEDIWKLGKVNTELSDESSASAASNESFGHEITHAFCADNAPDISDEHSKQGLLDMYIEMEKCATGTTDEHSLSTITVASRNAMLFEDVLWIKKKIVDCMNETTQDTQDASPSTEKNEDAEQTSPSKTCLRQVSPQELARRFMVMQQRRATKEQIDHLSRSCNSHVRQAAHKRLKSLWTKSSRKKTSI